MSYPGAILLETNRLEEYYLVVMMNSVEMTVSLPPNLSEDEARLLLAIKLYEVGKVSLGQAAKMAGFSKRTFIEFLGRHRVPVFNYSPEELKEELGL